MDERKLKQQVTFAFMQAWQTCKQWAVKYMSSVVPAEGILLGNSSNNEL